MLSYFQLQERGSSVRTEVLAGCTTFLTLAYIIFVNPLILGGAGMDTGAVLVATCLASAFGCLVMGLWANYPIALAPGMGLNAYFVAIAVGTLGLAWQVALGAVFLSGVLMFEHLGWDDAADDIINAVEATIGEKIVTYDFARLMDGATEVKCSEFASAIVDRL